MIRRNRRRERELAELERALNIKAPPDTLMGKILEAMPLVVAALPDDQLEELDALLAMPLDLAPEHQERLAQYFRLIAHAIENSDLFRLAMPSRELLRHDSPEVGEFMRRKCEEGYARLAARETEETTR